MRKLLNIIFAIAGIAYFALISFVNLNAVYNFANLGDTVTLIANIMAYGSLAILGGFTFINLFGKGPLRIIFFIIFILVAVLFILTSFFPDVIPGIIKPKA